MKTPLETKLIEVLKAYGPERLIEVMIAFFEYADSASNTDAAYRRDCSRILDLAHYHIVSAKTQLHTRQEQARTHSHRN